MEPNWMTRPVSPGSLACNIPEPDFKGTPTSGIASRISKDFKGTPTLGIERFQKDTHKRKSVKGTLTAWTGANETRCWLRSNSYTVTFLSFAGRPANSRWLPWRVIPASTPPVPCARIPAFPRRAESGCRISRPLFRPRCSRPAPVRHRCRNGSTGA